MTVPALTKKQRKPIIMKSQFLLARKLPEKIVCMLQKKQEFGGRVVQQREAVGGLETSPQATSC